MTARNQRRRPLLPPTCSASPPSPALRRRPRESGRRLNVNALHPQLESAVAIATNYVPFSCLGGVGFNLVFFRPAHPGVITTGHPHVLATLGSHLQPENAPRLCFLG